MRELPGFTAKLEEGAGPRGEAAPAAGALRGEVTFEFPPLLPLERKESLDLDDLTFFLSPLEDLDFEDIAGLSVTEGLFFSKFGNALSSCMFPVVPEAWLCSHDDCITGTFIQCATVHWKIGCTQAVVYCLSCPLNPRNYFVYLTILRSCGGKKLSPNTIMSEAPWELIYWGDWKTGENRMIGRGEFVRLIFEEAGVSYIEKGKEEGFVANFVWQGGNTGFPVFAPPIIRRGDFVLFQTASILRYLGTEFGLVPENKEDAAHADAICGVAMDFISEGRLAFHPVENTASYYTQVEEAKVAVAKWTTSRLPRWLNYLEKVAAQSTTGYLAGTYSYADIAVFHVLCAAESQFAEAYPTLMESCPKLAEFKERVAARPRISEYLKSDRRGHFEGNSMM